MNLRQLEYFVCVAEQGSFSKAAIVLGVAQPALSRQVRLLEEDLKVRLLTRNGRGVVLTESGKHLFRHSIDVMQMMSRIREQILSERDEPSGLITIGMPPSFGRMLTLRLAAEFRSNLPRARLSIIEGLTTHLTEWIATDRIDLAVLLNPEPYTALDILPVLDDPVCLVSAADGGRPATPTIAFADLPGLPLILPGQSHSIRRLVETQAVLAGIKLDVAWEVASVPSILELVLAGYGHAVLPSSAIAASHAPERYRLQTVTRPNLTSTLCLAASAYKKPTPLLLHVREMLATSLVEAVARPAGAAGPGAAEPGPARDDGDGGAGGLRNRVRLRHTPAPGAVVPAAAGRGSGGRR
ncbi:LysR family nitrogen assimilation transcriptional regulator [Rhodoplanes tepidamans]|uniref:LysR family transcriptional regulator n=1 Tax=Rhodoplanes TaxID=29407 RepID=UPI00278ABC5B|nr:MULTISPECIES: LysR family transcriptional regulator [Rhodoplanes]MDQ0357024.1 LysR family nitrogen assimilation transcriptional regulator [Rhodoplanes tepidamans]